MRSLLLVMMLAATGCELFFEDGGNSRCSAEDLPSNAVARSLPIPLRDPERLTCQSFGGGGTCDPACGACSELDDSPPPRAIPSWGVCASGCEALDEGACAASPMCRVVLDARCAISQDCDTDFLGCFAIDSAPDATVDCVGARDGWTCSRSASCTALHVSEPCAIDTQCERAFALCVPEGRSPGRCHEQPLCDAVGPSCPANTKAGVANGCFTGACIPLALCEPR
ncbi:MAG TPA: hypothetical protein VK427_24565 [Kofleriaceae bacterium]|nr:hypothetical protein [Kofleriaceae bacterium]